MGRASLLADLGRDAVDKGNTLALRPSLTVTWALVCGCVASGLLEWNNLPALRLLAAWLVADVILGCLFDQCVALKHNVKGGQPRRAVASPFFIPYAAIESPGHRFADRLNSDIAHWRDDIWPSAGHFGVTAITSAILALVIATYLGREILLAVSTALLLAAALIVITGKDEKALSHWLVGLQVMVAWALGHRILGAWRVPSLGMGAFFGISAYVRARLYSQDDASGVWFQRLLWWALVAALLVMRQPLLATTIAMVALSERISGNMIKTQKARKPTSRTAEQFGWLVAMFVVALGVTYWG